VRYIDIGDKKIGTGQPIFIIAEAGVNHNGSLRLAKKMIDAARSAGADAIKFQSFKTEEAVTRNAPKARYQKKASPGKLQFDMLRQLELRDPAFRQLKDYCSKKKILFFSTPFDSRSAALLYKLKVPVFKVSSGDLTNTPLLLQVARYNKPIILSTGMSTIKEVEGAVRAIFSTGNRRLILLHCTSNYPVRYKDVNLAAMDVLNKKFRVPVGYSDHTLGIEVSIAAVAKGARVIEKHFTIDRNLHGPDHKASLEPEDFKGMVLAIRNIEKCIGSSTKMPCRSEYAMRKIARKSIVSAVDLKKGAVINKAQLAIKRPGTGIEPMHMKRIIGRRVKVPIKKDNVLTWSILT